MTNTNQSAENLLHARKTSSDAVRPWENIPAKGPILRPPEAAAYYGVALSTYYMLIKRGDVPGFVKLSKHARVSGVPQGWLDAAIAARILA